MKKDGTMVYECKQCGTEVTVNSQDLKTVKPIYCCGLPMAEITKAAKTANTKSRGRVSSEESSAKKRKKPRL